MPPIFVFGTLRDDALRAAVAGGPLPGRPARLPGHAVARALDPAGAPQPFPILVARPGAAADGLLIAPDPTQRARLDAYEALFGYAPEPAEAEADGQTVPVLVYRGDIGGWRPGPDWDLASWARDWAALRRLAAAEVMALWPDHPPAAMAARYPMIEAAAASALRAAAQPAPAALRRAARPGDVESVAARRPYARFFGLREDDLRFRRFDGALAGPVTRAGFWMADAVTVLPWDPGRDRVLVVEQFRYGPYLRGDPNPWSLEAVAGRIDPGETPEAAARREAAEEARLALGRIWPVARYYPSPGAVSEYILSFVAEAELPDAAAGIAGLEAEAEDIRAHVLPLDRLLELVGTGEVENGPLVLTALWLDRHRLRLRDGG